MLIYVPVDRKDSSCNSVHVQFPHEALSVSSSREVNEKIPSENLLHFTYLCFIEYTGNNRGAPICIRSH